MPPNGSDDDQFDAEEFLKRMRAKVDRDWTGPVLFGVLALAILLGLFTSYYQVEPDEVGVLQRLGRYTGTADPGPHFKLPFGIDRVRKVAVQRQLKMEFGFRTAT